jgi:dethiobiotin synthetase
VSRPEHLVLCVGTGTEVGKTWVGAATLSAALAAHPGLRVAARKPVQSYAADDTRPTDAEVLASATGEDPEVVCPKHRWYAAAVAPPMAADDLGIEPFTVAELLDELDWPETGTDLGWVETVGGARSPMADDGDAVTMAALLDPDHIVVVADAGLGTINATLLTVAPLSHWQTTVVLNRFDPTQDLHLRNLGWLREREDLDVVVDVEVLAARLLDPL